MTCSKEFSITVSEAAGVCLTHTNTIAAVTLATLLEYDATNDRVAVTFIPGLSMEVGVINPNTEALLGAIPVADGVVGGLVYSPATSRVYVLQNPAPSVWLAAIVNIATMSVDASIALPATMDIPLGFPSADNVNNKLYLPVLIVGTADKAIVSIDPVAQTAAVLVVTGGVADAIGALAAYNTNNGRIYIPEQIAGSNFVRAYSAAGVLQESIAMPGPNFGGDELLFFCPENGLIYYVGVNQASGNRGLLIINPATSAIVHTIDYGALNPDWVCFTPGSANVMLSDGQFIQYSTTDHSQICSLNLVHAASARTVSVPSGKVFSAYQFGGVVEVLTP